MPYSSLHHFIKTLEGSGELVRITEFVDPNLEIAEIADRMVKAGDRNKALLFENTGTNFPLLINAFGSNKRMCMALGVNNLDDIAADIEGLFKKLTTPKAGLLE